MNLGIPVYQAQLHGEDCVARLCMVWSHNNHSQQCLWLAWLLHATEEKMNELHNTGIIIGLSLIFLEVYNALFLSLPSSEVHS